MCDPLSVASAVATVTGTVMQSRAQAAAQKGIESAMRANGEANDKLRANSQETISNNLQDFSREKFDQTQADQTADVKMKLMAALDGNKLPGEFYGGAQSENTRNYAEIKNKESGDKAAANADKLATLRGFSQGQGVNTRGIQRTGEVVGMNQNKEAGNNAVLPFQIEAAKAKGASPLGDLFTAAGTVMGAAGLAKGAGGFLDSQSSLSRSLAGMNTPANVMGPFKGPIQFGPIQGPVNGFAGTGFNLV